MRNRSPLAGTSHAAIEYRTLLLAYICTRNSLSRTKVEIERLDLDVLVAVLAICLYLPGCHCIIHSEVSFAASRSTDQHYACAAATNSNFARVSHGEKRKFSRECTYIYEYMRMYILYLLHIINYRYFALPRKNDQRNVFSNR